MKPAVVCLATLATCLTVVVLFPPRSSFTVLIGASRGYSPVVEEFRGHAPFWRPATYSKPLTDAYVLVAVSARVLALDAGLCLIAAALAYAAASRSAAGRAVPRSGEPRPTVR